jgi:hypothetical protein
VREAVAVALLASSQQHRSLVLRLPRHTCVCNAAAANRVITHRWQT